MNIAGMWDSAQPSGGLDANRGAEYISANVARYGAVAQIVGVPWWWIGCIHQLEAGGNFHCHLANGDPLTARTVHVPAGRPLTGTPPFTWEQSAIDALLFEGLSHGMITDPVSALDRAERYNGLGYRNRGLPSPYLWSGTNQYTSGKFVRDGVFDPHAVSDQPGVAALMMALQKNQVTLFIGV